MPLSPLSHKLRMFRYRFPNKDAHDDLHNLEWLSRTINSCTVDTTMTHLAATIPGEIDEETKKKLCREWKGSEKSLSIGYNTLSGITTVTVPKSANQDWILMLVDMCIACTVLILVLLTCSQYSQTRLFL